MTAGTDGTFAAIVHPMTGNFCAIEANEVQINDLHSQWCNDTIS